MDDDWHAVTQLRSIELRPVLREFDLRTLISSIVGVIAAAALLLTFGVPVNFLLGRLQSRVEADTGYRLRVDGGVTMGFWPSPTAFFRNVSVLDKGNGLIGDLRRRAHGWCFR